jgi:ParB/RepB/Spo0J family partition protein
MAEATEKPARRLEYVATGLIMESEVALRGVDRQSEDYMNLLQSIRKEGVLKPILLREIVQDGVMHYGLIDGLQRFTAAKDSAQIDIPAHIIDIEEADLMQAQIIANLHKVETKPAQYSLQLRRLLSQNPLLTKSELAEQLSTTPKWVDDRLSLTKLHSDIQKLVDSGELRLANAYALAKLPIEEQLEYLDRAITDKTTEFTGLIAQRIKSIRDARRAGKDPDQQQGFAPLARLQRLGDVKDEYDNWSVMSAILKEMNVKTLEDSWKAAITWVLNLDPISIENQKAKYEQKKKEREDSRERAKIEREKQRQEEAVKKQTDLMNL